jgi:hypothetical protein
MSHKILVELFFTVTAVVHSTPKNILRNSDFSHKEFRLSGSLKIPMQVMRCEASEVTRLLQRLKKGDNVESNFKDRGANILSTRSKSITENGVP